MGVGDLVVFTGGVSGAVESSLAHLWYMGLLSGIMEVLEVFSDSALVQIKTNVKTIINLKYLELC